MLQLFLTKVLFYADGNYIVTIEKINDKSIHKSFLLKVG